MCTNTGFHLIVSAMLEQAKLDMAKATRANGSGSRALKKNAHDAEEFLSSNFFENLCLAMNVSKETVLRAIKEDACRLARNGKSTTLPWLSYWRELREERANLSRPQAAAAA